MANAPRDFNQVPVKLGNSNGTPVPWSIEHTTGYLKVLIRSGSFVAPVIVPGQDRRDDNQVSAALGTYNNSVRNILIHHSTGNLRVTLV